MKYPGRFVLAIVLGVAIVAGMQLYKYNSAKKATTDGLTNGASSPAHITTDASANGKEASACCDNANGNYTAANPLGQNSDYGGASGFENVYEMVRRSCQVLLEELRAA